MGRSRRTAVDVSARREPAPYQETSLREIDARYAGRDPITDEEISPGEKIIYDREGRKAYKRDNPFAHVGPEGKYLWNLWKEDTDIDPVALASTWKYLRRQGQSPGEITRNLDGLFEEMSRWQRLQLVGLSQEELVEVRSSGNLLKAGHIPSVEMLQENFPSEELRAELEEVLREGRLSFRDLGRHSSVENGGWSEELQESLQEMSRQLSSPWTPDIWSRNERSYPGPWGMTTDPHATFPAYRRCEAMERNQPQKIEGPREVKRLYRALTEGDFSLFGKEIEKISYRQNDDGDWVLSISGLSGNSRGVVDAAKDFISRKLRGTGWEAEFKDHFFKKKYFDKEWVLGGLAVTLRQKSS